MTMNPPNFRNLEAVSNAENTIFSGAEKRRVPRLSLAGGQFRLAKNGKIFAVADLSAGGLSLRVLDRHDLILFPVGTKLEGLLNLNGEKHPIKAKVRHIGGDLVGCEFDELDSKVKSILERTLNPASLGIELRLIPSSEAGALWYHGPFGTELVLWRGSDGTVSRVRLLCLGHYIQWDDEFGVSTGVAKHSFETSEEHGVVRFETMLLEADDSPSPEKLEIAKKLILSSNVPEDLKRWCSSQLT